MKISFVQPLGYICVSLSVFLIVWNVYLVYKKKSTILVVPGIFAVFAYRIFTLKAHEADFEKTGFYIMVIGVFILVTAIDYGISLLAKVVFERLESKKER